MNKGKKLTAAVAAAATTAAMVAPAFADASSFTDIDNSYAKDAINALVAKGVIHGVDATHFNPTGQITRQDFAVILAGALGLDVSNAPATATFSDVPTTNYAFKYVEALHKAGIVSGVSATEFGYGQNITRQDMAAMYVRALGVDVTGKASSLTFADKDQIASYAQDAVGYAVSVGLFHGMDATHFAPTANATREQVALVANTFMGMVNQGPQLSSATLVDNSTITLNFDKAVSSVATSDVAVAVKASGASVSVSSVTLSADGKSATVKLASPMTAGTTYSVTYKGVEKDVTTAGQLAVSSVAALNANEIAVTFNNAVEATTAQDVNNYTVVVGPTGTTPLAANGTAYTATLQSDNKTVIIRLATPMANGTAYNVSAANVLDSAYNAMTAYTDTTKLFNDTAAPVVKSASVSGQSLVLTFNKPIDPAATGTSVKVDGVAAGAGLVADTGAAAQPGGDYTYTVDLSGNTAVDSLTAVGQHTVTVYNISDYNSPANTTAVQSVTMNVTQNTTAPSVVSVTPVSSNTFAVKFSEPLTLTNSMVTVKNGNYTFHSTTDVTTNEVTVGLDTSDATGCTYDVTVNPLDSYNPLYAAGQSSVNLAVAVSGFVDSSNLYGAPYSGSVTLSQPTNGPSVIAAGLNSVDVTGQLLKVKFNENIATPVASDVTVTQNGIVIPLDSTTPVAVESTPNGNVLDIKLASALVPGSYNVSLAAGAVSDSVGTASKAQNTTVNYSTSAVYFQPATVTPQADDSFIVDFGATHPMSSSAANVANYQLDGAALPAGSTAAFYGDQTKVKITLPAGHFATNTQDLLEISTNVTDQNGEVVGTATGGNYTDMVSFNDNVAPVLKTAQFTASSTSASYTNQLLLSFSEPVSQSVSTAPFADDDFTVTVNGAAVSYTEHVNNDGTITLTLPANITLTQPVKVSVNAVGSSNPNMNTTDLAGNALTSGTQVSVSGLTTTDYITAP